MSPVPARVQLGPATLVRDWWLDVNTGTTAEPVWIGVFGMEAFKITQNTTWKDTSDMDSGGFKSSTGTALEWGLEIKVSDKLQSGAAAYDPGQEALRACAGSFGLAGNIEIRYYKQDTPKSKAFQGIVGVEYTHDGGAMDDVDKNSFKLIGQGLRNAITHPDTVASVPVVYSFAPITGPAAGGTLVTVRGSGFTGTVATTGVKFGATNATSWNVVDDDTIVALAPAHAAGAVAVVVTNATGPSTTGPTYLYV